MHDDKNFNETADTLNTPTESATTSGANTAQVLPAFAVSDSEAVNDEFTEEEEIQPPFPQKSARELKRLPPDMFTERRTTKKTTDFLSLGWKGKIAGFLLAGLVAMVAGFFVAGFIAENSDAMIARREHERQVLTERQTVINEETARLEQEKKRLELEKELLAAKKKSLEQEESRLAGKHEQLYAEETANADSFISRLIDKVTGRDQERREEMSRTAKEKAAATKDGDEVDRALRDAQDTLDDVNEKLAAARAMKKDIDSVRRQIEAAYAENKDVVDAAIYYTKAGATAMLNIFGGKIDDRLDSRFNDELNEGTNE